MKKPKLPKRWKRRIHGVSFASDDLSLSFWEHGGKATTVVLYIGRVGHEIQVSIYSGAEGPGVRPTRKIIRAVELAAIHAGLVEDREP
ncbi:MAG: hypothetical protein PHU54_07160 [Candidatus Omnitrophica bacterium]|nr:hypothetical protein [Candidatus Omnitrophota bacterium]